ncbi:GNAT family N-acetyltransferase [Sphingomonas sp.]|uniref:GNAT family N-acetyltransferase n=1 Tax=Sphingomonas sp. TaxID=28214 RepID=UPI003B3BCA2B
MIDTERLLLRPYLPADLPAMLALTSDPELRAFVGNLPDGEEAAWARLLRWAGHWSLFDCGTFAVFEKASGRLIGEVAAAFFHRGVDPMFDHVPEASWLLSSEARGRGFAYEAMAGLLGWVRRSTRHDRVACLIEPINAPSLKLAARLGFHPVRDVTYRDKPFLLLAT